MRDSTAGRGESGLNKRQDVERMRVWAEKVERERKREQRRDGSRQTQRQYASKDIEKGGQSDGWSISTGVIDAIVDQLNPAKIHKPLPSADAVISNLTRRVRTFSFSSDSDTPSALVEENPSSGNRRQLAEERAAKTTSRRARHEQARKKPLPPPRSGHYLTTATAESANSSAGVMKPNLTSSQLSIDEIIRKHSGAVDTAIETAKEKARRDLGLPSPVTSSQLSLSPPPTARAVSSDLPNAGVVAPLPGDTASGQAAVSTNPSPRLATRPAAAEIRALNTSAVAGFPDDSSSDDSVLEDVVIGQALLDKLETGSLDSSRTTGGPRFGHHSSLPPSARDTASPSPSVSSRLSKRKSLPASAHRATEEENHNLAVYLRSTRLNRFLHLSRPFPERPLHVSLADIGSSSGTPVLVFLGIGCVRHLIALFDDLAKALHLRLICIDRWGFGKTSNVPQEKRLPLEWAAVVERVLAELRVEDVRIIAHSAGAPYAAATALRLGSRVKGKLHLLAPWISADIDGGYKWLKWVPNGVIKGAFAAEWRLQSYRLGKPPPLVHSPVSSTDMLLDEDEYVTADGSENNLSRNSSLGRSESPRKNRKHGLVRRASQLLGGKFEPPSTPSPLLSPANPGSKRRSFRDLSPSDSRVHARGSPLSAAEPRPNSSLSASFTASTASDLLSETVDEGIPYSKGDASPSLFRTNLPNISVATIDKPPTDATLFQALEQASHAECEPGTTDDLMTIILNRPGRPWGFSYADLTQPATIWWGSEDERISEKSVRWLERVMPRGTEVNVVAGGDHNLMRNVPVMCEIFQRIVDEEPKLG